MFTGLVEEMGRVSALTDKKKGVEIQISAPKICQDLKLGDSVSVNGCCLTAIDCNAEMFSATIVKETLDKTALFSLKRGDQVNLERALRPQDRLGGHYVQGHIDGTGIVSEKESQVDGSIFVTITPPKSLMGYCAIKGSIAIDGVSLTIAKRTDKTVSIALIPHTAKETTLGRLQVGKSVNLEVDILAKYLETLLMATKEKS